MQCAARCAKGIAPRVRHGRRRHRRGSGAARALRSEDDSASHAPRRRGAGVRGRVAGCARAAKVDAPCRRSQISRRIQLLAEVGPPGIEPAQTGSVRDDAVCIPASTLKSQGLRRERPLHRGGSAAPGRTLTTAPSLRTLPALSGDLFTRAAAIVAHRVADGQGGEVEVILARGLAQARAAGTMLRACRPPRKGCTRTGAAPLALERYLAPQLQ
jgi:hypothetical protein